MSTPVVIAGCGARKLDRPTVAAQMYVGPYSRECIRTAFVIGQPGRVFILSARYGLLAPADVIEPYDLASGQPGVVTAARLVEQASGRGILSAPVVALCASRYTSLLREVWSDVLTPLAGLGIGRQRAVLASLCRASVLGIRP